MNANVNTHLSEMLLRTANILMNKDRLFGNLRGAPHQWGRFRRKLAKTPPPVSNTTPNPKEPKDNHLLQCPSCGNQYNHIRKIETINGDDDYKAGWDGKGDLLVISFNCEENCRWDLCIGFHKGLNFMFTRIKHTTKKNTAETS